MVGVAIPQKPTTPDPLFSREGELCSRAAGRRRYIKPKAWVVLALCRVVSLYEGASITDSMRICNLKAA